MTPDTRGEVTRLLEQAGNGDPTALERVAPLVYDELRRLASSSLRNRPRGQTLRTTDLVHEAYLKLVTQPDAHWQGRSHFMAVAAKAMRSILIDYIRSREAIKRGGNRDHVPMDQAIAAFEEKNIDLLDLNAALDRLSQVDERKARVVELRFFAGLSVEETASVIGVGHATVERDWQVARAWLHRELGLQG